MRAHRYSDSEMLRDPVTGKLNAAEFRYRLRGWLAVLLALSLLFGGLGYGAYKGYEAYNAAKTAKDFAGPGGADVEVKIPKNLTTLQIGKLLVEKKVIKDAARFQSEAQKRPDLYAKVKAGTYRLQTGVPSLTALQQLTDAQRAVRVWVTLKEGGRLVPEMAAALAAGLKTDAAGAKAVTELLSSATPEKVGAPTWCTEQASNAKLIGTKLEGFVYPDTYEVVDGSTPESLTKKAVAQFNAVATQLNFAAEAQGLPFKSDAGTAALKSCRALTVASIVEREVSRDEDRPKVARVIYNRLAKKMPLGMDSTINYIKGRTGKVFTSEADRKIDSPYNTYLKPGLPPGPISSAGEAAMNAALNPDEGDWLYFVTVNLDTGETAFSSNQADHDKARAQLAAWCAASPANQAKCKPAA